MITPNVNTKNSRINPIDTILPNAVCVPRKNTRSVRIYRQRRINRNKRKIIIYWNNLIKKNGSCSSSFGIFSLINTIYSQFEHKIINSNTLNNDINVDHLCGDENKRRIVSIVMKIVHTFYLKKIFNSMTEWMDKRNKLRSSL